MKVRRGVVEEAASIKGKRHGRQQVYLATVKLGEDSYPVMSLRLPNVGEEIYFQEKPSSDPESPHFIHVVSNDFGDWVTALPEEQVLNQGKEKQGRAVIGPDLVLASFMRLLHLAKSSDFAEHLTASHLVELTKLSFQELALSDLKALPTLEDYNHGD